MGVKSLTAYLDNRSSQYFENYQLHDCKLIIDGSSLCFNLYNWKCSFWKTGYSYDCYGGDYDKYAEIVRGFFKMLQRCNVEPYIVFGGRNGVDRVSLITNRLSEKMKAATEVTPVAVRMERANTSKWRNHLPLIVALKSAFRDVLNELSLKTFTCEGDPNREIACLAKHLKCPVLSANSDFFVLGSMFIVFSSLSCKILTSNDTWKRMDKELYYFMPCKIYKIENLLCDLNKRPNNNFILYLLPVLLGSDFIKPEALTPFLIRILDVKSPRQQKVDAIFNWIRKQHTLEAALKIILDSFDNQREKNVVSGQINRVIVGYSSVSITPLLEHFGIEQNSNNPPRASAKFRNLEQPSGSNSEKTDVGKKYETGSDLFMKRLRDCRYPSFFADMLKENRYLLQTNIDDCTRPDSNSIGFTIMSAIHNILVQNDGKLLTVFRRNSDIKMEEYVLPALTDQLPSIEEIDYLRVENRLDILLRVLEIDQNFCQVFEGISKAWHLFLLSLKYTTSNSKLDSPFIYSLVLCFIILNYVDLNFKGFYRRVEDIELIHKENQYDDHPRSEDSPKISTKDSIILMQKCIHYFEMDPEDNDHYDRGIMHSIAEFQCVFLHLKYLNNLLDFPVQDAVIYKIFDNTFIYNLTKNLRNESSLKDYLNIFLRDCPSINCEFLNVLELLKSHSIL